MDVWELCTSYYVPNNRYGRKQLESALESLGYQTGIIHREQRPEYSREYRVDSAAEVGRPALRASPVLPKYGNGLGKRTGCVVAGAAGKKIISAATSFCRGAVLSGLWVSQSNAYPVTVGTGYSTSTVILSPDEILFTGISKPDVMVALFPEGLNVVRGASQAAHAGRQPLHQFAPFACRDRCEAGSPDFDRAGGDGGGSRSTGPSWHLPKCCAIPRSFQSKRCKRLWQMGIVRRTEPGGRRSEPRPDRWSLKPRSCCGSGSRQCQRVV